MNFGIYDFVIIVCEIPFGLWEEDSNVPHVKGNLGIITEILEDKDYDGGVCFRVKDEKGNEFVYLKSELIRAFESDIRRVLRELLEWR